MSARPREPIGSVPLGDSSCVGQFRAAGILSMLAASPRDVFGSSLRVSIDEGSRPLTGLRASCVRLRLQASLKSRLPELIG
jgi:hypothetical protein